MPRRLRPLSAILAVLLLAAQWVAVQHALSHLGPDSAATGGSHLACSQCVASAPLLAGMVTAATVAAVLHASVEALPPAFEYAVHAGPVRHAYRSRAPPA